jgi:hypothetical protein
MEKVEKYSYLDWWKGSICLMQAPLWVNKDNKDELPTRVNWDEIMEDDIIKIKEKQKEIFNTAVTEKLGIWQADFLRRYSKSEFQDILLDDEMNKFCGILFDPISIQGNNVSINGILFDPNSIASIKGYIASTKIGGEDFDFDLIHSINCIYQNSVSNNDIIYAEATWKYLKWMETFKKSEITIAENEQIFDKEKKKELENPNPLIFKNGQSYRLFLELKQAIVIQKSEYADISFIFRKLRYCDQEAINPTVTHKIFIKYLNYAHSIKIKHDKFTNATSKRKEAIFSDIFEKYKDLI